MRSTSLHVATVCGHTYLVCMHVCTITITYIQLQSEKITL